MRLTLVVPVVVAALGSCGGKPASPPPPPGQDLTIDVVLAKENNKCVVRFTDGGLKVANNAIGWTKHTVTWKVVGNTCGEKTKINKKALGLKHMKLKGTPHSAFWLRDCTALDRVPPAAGVEFHCSIPSATDSGWNWGTGNEKIYEYEIDGDEVEPVDPDIGIRRNG